MESETYSTLLVSRCDGVLEITLNRPKVHNAIDDVLIAELTSCLREAERRQDRAIVLSGAGASFCAGADLHWMERTAGYSDEENLEDARRLQRMFAALDHFPGVTIAVVHGAAIGGGAGLAAVCDVAIADQTARFGLSEVRLGLVPAIIAPYVIEKVGPGTARSLFVTGERFDAARALQIGLVFYAVGSAEEGDALVKGTVERVLEAGPGAVATAKRLVREVAGRAPDDVADITARCIAELRGGPEAQEGMRAFLEKRPPAYARRKPEA
jgi:methylglutaconyl-CoA hydratase